MFAWQIVWDLLARPQSNRVGWKEVAERPETAVSGAIFNFRLTDYWERGFGVARC